MMKNRMPKYKEFKSTNADAPLIRAVNNIANELAEANKLKRLDIQSRPQNHPAYANIIEDLKDDA